MLQNFIENLKNLSKKNFPKEETTQYFKNYPNLIQEIDPYIFYNEKNYTRNLIFYSNSFELIAVCWLPGQKAEAHGHEGEKCWARVENGELRFLAYNDEIIDNKVHLNLLSDFVARTGHLDGPAYIHAVENVSNDKAISLHLYTRPFKECDIYVDEKVIRKKLGYYSKFGKIIEL